MSCFFCDSFLHLSHFCDIYISDESRKKIYSEKCCKICSKHKSSCQLIQKCIICFSKDHNSSLCPERFNYASNYFVPKIDVDILPRFFKTFNPTEHFFLAFFLPKDSNFITLKPLHIIGYKKISRSTDYENTVVTTKSITVDGTNTNLNLLNFIASQSLIIKAKKVELNSAKISAENFLLFLSPFLISLRCSDLEFTSKIKFPEILKRKFPKIEILKFDNTNIEIENSWPQILLNICSNNFAELQIEIKNFDFNVETFFTFFTTKRTKNVFNKMQMEFCKDFICQKTEKEISQEFSKNFILTNSFFQKIPRLSIFAKDNIPFIPYTHSFEYFTLK